MSSRKQSKAVPDVDDVVEADEPEAKVQREVGSVVRSEIRADGSVAYFSESAEGSYSREVGS